MRKFVAIRNFVVIHRIRIFVQIRKFVSSIKFVFVKIRNFGGNKRKRLANASPLEHALPFYLVLPDNVRQHKKYHRQSD